MDVRKLKEGTIRRYKSGLLSSKWKDGFAVLYSDSTFSIYSQKSDTRPSESFLLKDIAPYICIGLMTDRMPTRRPALPSGASVHHLVGFGMDPRADKVCWVLFSSDSELESWFNEVMKTLPKPANPPPSAPLPPQPSAPAGGYVPPAQYPSAPNSYVPQPYNGGPPPYSQPAANYPPPPTTAYAAGGPAYPAAAPQYPPQSTNTTVIVDRTRDYGSSGIGSGMGGMAGGMLMGGLLGYGLGSFFAPHHHYGGGFGYGGGYGGGFGGGYPSVGPSSYMQDNDTYVTNNYYNYNNDDHSTVTNTDYGDRTLGGGFGDNNGTLGNGFGDSSTLGNGFGDSSGGALGGGFGDNYAIDNDTGFGGGGLDFSDGGGFGGFDGGDW